MSFQAYIDTVKAKTGKTPDDFRTLARQKGLVKFGEVVAWLKADFALGHGHANAIAQLIVNPDARKAGPDDKASALFAGSKAGWRAAYDALVKKVALFGADFAVAPTNTYVSLLRGGRKFAILQPSSAERLDIGIKLKDAPASGRFEAAGSWNLMVTHRVRIAEPKQINAELLAWLRRAYDAAG